VDHGEQAGAPISTRRPLDAPWRDGHTEAMDDPTPSLAPGAADILRGVARALCAADQAVLPEVPLANGRRADLLALDRSGAITLVEIKSCRADFRADRKWQSYLEFCDRFYFAVAAGFPLDLLPEGEGLILADRFAGEILREARPRTLCAARRKAMLIRFARASAGRLRTLLDPQP
jgi:hypothetical protein